MSQIRNKFLGPIEATPAKPNTGVQQGDGIIAALGKLQGQINAGSCQNFTTYAAAFAALYGDQLGPNQLVWVAADENNGNRGAWYLANTGTDGLVLDFDFLAQTYSARQLTLLVVDQPPVTPTSMQSDLVIPDNSQLLAHEEIDTNGFEIYFGTNAVLVGAVGT